MRQQSGAVYKFARHLIGHVLEKSFGIGEKCRTALKTGIDPAYDARRHPLQDLICNHDSQFVQDELFQVVHDAVIVEKCAGVRNRLSVRSGDVKNK